MVSSIFIAFALVVLSGACAPLGACVVLFMKRSNRQLLAGSLALAAGVMVFVSLTEVLGESLEDLAKGGLSMPVQHVVAYLAFFGGVLVCWALDAVTDFALNWAARRSSTADSETASQCPDILNGKRIVGDEESDVSPIGHITVTAGPSSGSETPSATDDILVLAEPGLQEAAAAMQSSAEHHDELQLARTSLLIGLALAFHNLPEGLATFVGFHSSPHLGITIAIAIAVHNIPEGIAVGVPVYFATGSRLKAIGWAAVSGLAEPLGAVIGLAVQLSGHLNPVAMGIIMALVAGIMTGVAVRELIPRALMYDPAHRWVIHGIFTGMAIMAASLVLLGLWDPAV